MKQIVLILIVLFLISGCQPNNGPSLIESSSASSSQSLESSLSEPSSSSLEIPEIIESSVASSEEVQQSEAVSSQILPEVSSSSVFISESSSVPTTKEPSIQIYDRSNATPEELNEITNQIGYYCDEHMDMAVYGGRELTLDFGLIIYSKDLAEAQEVMAGFTGKLVKIEYEETDYTINDLLKIQEEITNTLKTMTEYPSARIIGNHVQVSLFGDRPEYREFKKFLLSYPEKKKVVLIDSGAKNLPTT